jgi:hypothetical protein
VYPFLFYFFKSRRGKEQGKKEEKRKEETEVENRD